MSLFHCYMLFTVRTSFSELFVRFLCGKKYQDISKRVHNHIIKPLIETEIYNGGPETVHTH